MNRWDITVKQSNYDFNPFRESDHGKYFKTVTNIYEDWSKELEYANKQQYDFYWPSPVKPDGDHFDYEYENKLVEDWGIPKDFVIYLITLVIYLYPHFDLQLKQYYHSNLQLD